MNTKPTPTQLADWLDNEVPGGGFHFNQQLELCCAELRRLAAVEAERDQLRAEVEALRAAGARLATIAFNLGQNPDRVSEYGAVDAMKEAVKGWSAARKR